MEGGRTTTTDDGDGKGHRDDDERRRENVRLAPSDVLDEASRATLEQLRALGYVDAEARIER